MTQESERYRLDCYSSRGTLLVSGVYPNTAAACKFFDDDADHPVIHTTLALLYDRFKDPRQDTLVAVGTNANGGEYVNWTFLQPRI